MTGYGRGEVYHQGLKFTVELNSVNRKQSDIMIDLPRELIELEPRIRDEINAAISRGRVNGVIAWHRANGGKGSEASLDEEIARVYVRGIEKLKKELKLTGPITIDTILRCPGVLKLAEKEIDADRVWIYVEKALKQALNGLLVMREKEGKHLCHDLLKRLKLLSEGVQVIKKLAPAMIGRYREQLHERIRKSGIELSFEDERLVREVAIFADRSDISEELTRLESHLAQFKEKLSSTEPVGRALDFLSQEINREINTVGSKANYAEVSQKVVVMKSELEKIREQVQNIE